MFSDEWKKEAIKRFPEIAEYELEYWDNPNTCWSSLLMSFKKAYKDPRNDNLIKRIYGYSEWCLEQPRGGPAEDDLFSIVIVAFIEHIPTIPEAMQDMPRWIPYETVKGSEEIFSYFEGKVGYKKILEVYKEWQDSGRPMARD